MVNGLTNFKTNSMGKKLNLKELKVNSFKTSNNPKMKTIAGGIITTWGIETYCYGATCAPSCQPWESCGTQCDQSFCICD